MARYSLLFFFIIGVTDAVAPEETVGDRWLMPKVVLDEALCGT